jgi:2,4-dienoyl-CoA reductase (NADPH2)
MTVSNDSHFKKILEPFHIGNVKTRNRIIKTASGTSMWDPGVNRVSVKALAFYEALARGGVGLIMVESPITEYPFDEPGDVRMRIDDDSYIKEASKLAEIIHKYGCPAFVQMYHRGPWPQEYAPKRERIAASPISPAVVRSPLDIHDDKIPREITIAEIEQLVSQFIGFAERLKKAGFDGVELNSGSDSLLATFLSRFWNKRTDAYGFSSLENRTRFLVQIITGIKKRLGKDFPISVLINAVEFGGGSEGMTYQESKAIAKILQEAGADALHIRSQWFGNHVGSYNLENLFYPEPQIPLKSFPKELDWSREWRGPNVLAAATIKGEVSIPIITVGGIGPALGEQVLRQGKADFIGMCRPLFADPELPNKLAAGRINDIAPCTRCGSCQKMNALPKECRVNAALGKEDYTIKKAEHKKVVVVVGGGPAGMEASRVAALRGHKVVLYEREPKSGGLLPLATLVKGTEIEDIPALKRYFNYQLKELGVDVRAGKDFSLAELERVKPDVLITACGGITVSPDIKGIDNKIVIKNSDLHNMLKQFLKIFSPPVLRWLTKFWMPLGKKIVVIGGNIQGCQLAEFLVKRGRTVTIVDSVEINGEGMIPERKKRLFRWFEAKGVNLFGNVKYESITDNGIVFTTKEGKRQTVEADNIVISLPLIPNTIFQNIAGKMPEVYTIGDCSKPGLILDAITAGWKIARTL